MSVAAMLSLPVRRRPLLPSLQPPLSSLARRPHVVCVRRSLATRPSDPPDPKQQAQPKQSFKELLAKHGPAALITYAVLSGISFAGFYIAVVASGLDPKALLHKLPFSGQGHAEEQPRILSSKNEHQHQQPYIQDRMQPPNEAAPDLQSAETAVGAAVHFVEDSLHAAEHAVENAVAASIDTAESVVAVGVEGLEAIIHMADTPSPPPPTAVELPSTPPKSWLEFDGTVVLVAWCVHELFLPIRLGLTAYLTPRVAARLRGSAFDILMHRAMNRVGELFKRRHP
ncbi:hypothetical protein HDU83_008912 [Entophlyctis luteolus]|nr:hypothetical protein HDU82_005084 [Entophlyctis luteolus]KAJ3351410.1 hypothetical protein HDU83_008912 [Entophlyctis luteolus]KAJ3390940.1 hypothetical protein HDU84_006784 [Entophlyctis sp. JEL0112]